MKKNNPTFKDKVDDLLRRVRDAGALDDNNGGENWKYSDAEIEATRKALDQAYQEKFLERLPEEREKPYNENNQGQDLASATGFQNGYNACLADVKAAIKKEVG